MKNIFLWILFMVTGIIVLVIPVTPSYATIEQDLTFESEPAGAEVFLGRGKREIPLGKTPLVHKIEFHSEISIIRIIFKKKGYNPLTLKVKADQDKVLAKLESLPITAEPGIHQDEYLRNLQKRLNPIIAKAVPELLDQDEQQNYNLAGPIKVAGAKGGAFVVFPIFIKDLNIDRKGGRKAHREKLLKTVWKQLGASIVIPLARQFRDRKEVEGVILDASFEEMVYTNEFSPTVKNRQEMECVPGYRSQMVMQMKQVPYYRYETRNGVTTQVFAGYRTESTLVPQQVYDPCLSTKSVTRSSIAFDSKAHTAKDRTRARFLLTFNSLEKNTDLEGLYEKLRILLTDAKGKELMSQGTINIPRY